MSEQRRAIIISTGMDNLPLLKSLQETPVAVGSMLDKVKGLYAKFGAEKAAIEAAENDASLARLAKNLEEKAALQKAWMEKQTAMSVIGGGSGGYGSGFNTAEQKAAGEAVETAEKKVVGYAEGAAIGSGITAVLTHIAKLGKDIIFGEWSRAANGFLALLRHAGGASSVLPIVGLAVAAATTAWESRQSLRAARAETGNLDPTMRKIDERIAKEIATLHAAGKISDAQMEIYNHALSNPSYENTRLLQERLAAIGVMEEQTRTKIEQHQKALADYAERRAEGEKIIAEQQQKQLDLTMSMSREYRGLYEEAQKVRQDYARIDQGTMSLEDLAGRSRTERLDRAYGKGGIYDLGSGDGPFADIAYDAELARYQQRWDIAHGFAQFDAKGTLIGGTAFQDKQRQIADENLLGAAGLQTPAMQAAEMKRHLEDISTKIGDLLTTAVGKGINIADPSGGQ